MPVWLEVFIAWVTIGAVLNIAAMVVFRKKGYFRWLNTLYDSEAYQKGYEDAKAHEINEASVYNTFPRSVLVNQVREHGIEDNRYK